MENARSPRAFFFCLVFCCVVEHDTKSIMVRRRVAPSRTTSLRSLELARPSFETPRFAQLLRMWTEIYFGGGTVSISLPVNTIGPVAEPVGEPPSGSTVTA